MSKEPGGVIENRTFENRLLLAGAICLRIEE